jgi:tRNA pseudouridine55 synthase
VSARRGESGLSGILLVDKPTGLTSHDVVNRVRRATGERRVGHAGTLDPMATGLLVVLVGPATRLASYLTSAEKAYTARIAFGAETATDDAEGEVVRTAPCPVLLLRVAEEPAA